MADVKFPNISQNNLNNSYVEPQINGKGMAQNEYEDQSAARNGGD